jgi:hypothetical protein
MLRMGRLSGTVSSSPRRGIAPRMNYALNGRFNAHRGPLCASARIIVDSCQSSSGVRTFSDFSANASGIMEFKNRERMATQVIAGQSEAATVAAGRGLSAAEKYAHKRIMAG